MAEKDPINIPPRMPPPEEVVNKFLEFFARPLPALSGLSLRQLFGWEDVLDEHAARFALLELDNPVPEVDIAAKLPMTNRAWVVGSTIWRPAVLNQPFPTNKDIDIIFADQGAAMEFIGKAFAKLSAVDGKEYYHIAPNNVGGHKLINTMTGNGIIDAWDLEPGQTIAEHLMGFKHPHERVAVSVAARQDDMNALTRIVKEAQAVYKPKKSKQQPQPAPSYDYGS